MLPYLSSLGWGQILTIIIQVVLPLVVGFVTKRSMPSGIKALLLLLLTVISQSVSAALQADVGNGYHWSALLGNIGLGFLISVGVHYGLWKPTGASDTAQDAGPVTDQHGS
jgi:predicted Na+-dependent transporter